MVLVFTRHIYRKAIALECFALPHTAPAARLYVQFSLGSEDDVMRQELAKEREHV